MLASFLVSIPGPVFSTEMASESEPRLAVMTLMTRGPLLIVDTASIAFWTRLRRTSRSWPMLADIRGNSDANFMRLVILWLSNSLRSNSTTSRANAFMFTSWCSLSPPLNKLRKFSNTSLARPVAPFMSSKSFSASSMSGSARLRNHCPAPAFKRMAARGCLTSWAIAATTASALVSLFARSCRRLLIAVERLV